MFACSSRLVHSLLVVEVVMVWPGEKQRHKKGRDDGYGGDGENGVGEREKGRKGDWW